jgi:hypothetical protein
MGGAVRLEVLEQRRTAAPAAVEKTILHGRTQRRRRAPSHRIKALRRAFDFYAALVDPGVALDMKKPTFDLIQVANETLSFQELYQLLNDFNVVPRLVSRAELVIVWNAPQLARKLVGRTKQLEFNQFPTALALCALLARVPVGGSADARAEVDDGGGDDGAARRQLDAVAAALVLDDPAAQRQRILELGSRAQMRFNNRPKTPPGVLRRRALAEQHSGGATFGDSRSGAAEQSNSVPRGSVRDLRQFLKKKSGQLTAAEADRVRARLAIYTPAMALALDGRAMQSAAARCARDAAPETTSARVASAAAAARKCWTPVGELCIDAGTLSAGDVRRNAFTLRVHNDGCVAARARLWTTVAGVVLEHAVVRIPPYEKRDVAVHLFPPRLAHAATRAVVGEVTVAVGAAPDLDDDLADSLVSEGGRGANARSISLAATAAATASETTVQCPFLMLIQPAGVRAPRRERYAQAKCKRCSNARLLHGCAAHDGTHIAPVVTLNPALAAIAAASARLPVKTSQARRIHAEVPAPPAVATQCPTPLHARAARGGRRRRGSHGQRGDPPPSRSRSPLGRERMSPAMGGGGKSERRVEQPPDAIATMARDAAAAEPASVRWSLRDGDTAFEGESSGGVGGASSGAGAVAGGVPPQLGAGAVEAYQGTFSARSMLVTPQELLTYRKRVHVENLNVRVREISDIKELVSAYRRHGQPVALDQQQRRKHRALRSRITSEEKRNRQRC